MSPSSNLLPSRMPRRVRGAGNKSWIPYLIQKAANRSFFLFCLEVRRVVTLGIAAFPAGSIFQSLSGRPIHGQVFPFANGHNNDDDAVVVNFVNKSVTGVF